MAPVVADVERTLQLDEDSDRDPSRRRPAGWLWRAVVRTLLVVLTATVAFALPYFPDFMTLLGACSMCMMIFILPVSFGLCSALFVVVVS